MLFIALVFLFMRHKSHSLDYNDKISTIKSKKDFMLINKKTRKDFESVKSPVPHQHCKYPFKEFLTQFDHGMFIECLIKTEYLVDRQESSTLSKARQFYTSRYHYLPPKSFDQWYNYASSKKCQIDIYDDLMLKINRFKSNLSSDISIEEQIESLILSLPDNRQIKIVDFLKEKVLINNKEKQTKLSYIFNKFAKKLPSFRVLLNDHDLPFVVSTQSTNMNKQIHLAESSSTSFEWLVKAAGSIDIDSHARNPFLYLINLSLHCQSPFLIKDLVQGYSPLIQPSSLKQTLNSIPVLSTSAYPCLTSDILIPSSEHYSKDKSEDNTAWEDKKNILIWRGDTYGSTFKNYDNENFNPDHVCHEKCLPTQIKMQVYQDKSKRGWFWNIRQRFVSFSHHYDQIDAGFTAFEDMDKDSNRENKLFFWGSTSLSKNQLFKHKYVFSMDGLGHYIELINLLKSNSLVFNANFAQNWFTEYLIPFYHYIPINPGYEKIESNVLSAQEQSKLKQNYKKWFKMKFESNDPHLYHPIGFNDVIPKLHYYIDHDEEAHHIALTGNDFGSKFLRNDDMDCYIYRVLVELSELL